MRKATIGSLLAIALGLSLQFGLARGREYGHSTYCPPSSSPGWWQGGGGPNPLGGGRGGGDGPHPFWWRGGDGPMPMGDGPSPLWWWGSGGPGSSGYGGGSEGPKPLWSRPRESEGPKQIWWAGGEGPTPLDKKPEGVPPELGNFKRWIVSNKLMRENTIYLPNGTDPHKMLCQVHKTKDLDVANFCQVYLCTTAPPPPPPPSEVPFRVLQNDAAWFQLYQAPFAVYPVLQGISVPKGSPVSYPDWGIRYSKAEYDNGVYWTFEFWPTEFVILRPLQQVEMALIWTPLERSGETKKKP